MSRGKRLQIKLKPRDRQQVEKLLGGGLQAVRTTLRALALRQMDQGQSTPAVGANLGLSAKAVWQIGKRYIDGGLERALFDAPRPGKAASSGSAGAAAHYRRGMLAAARGAGTLDGAAVDRRSYQAQNRSPRGQRDHSDSAGKP